MEHREVCAKYIRVFTEIKWHFSFHPWSFYVSCAEVPFPCISFQSRVLRFLDNVNHLVSFNESVPIRV